MTAPAPRRTPLHPVYAALGARLVEFHGWELPVQFSGIVAEHLAVRQAAGLFDVSHMGRIAVEGPGAVRLLERLAASEVASLAVGQVGYALLGLPDGGILDDVTVFRLGAEEYLLCVNAANVEKDLSWVRDHAPPDARVEDRSAATAMLALQGPAAERILAPLTRADLAGLDPWRFVRSEVAERPAVVSRTGYTGEDGFEILLAREEAVPVWERILAPGRAQGLLPAGLGARDTLRLEMGYPLWGSDMDETTDPLEAGLERFVRLDKRDFIGREAILERRLRKPRRRLAGFALRGPGVPRRGHRVLAEGGPVGMVTSGTFSPSLRRGIGLACLREAVAAPGTPLELEIRGGRVPAEVVRVPFYRSGSVKRRKEARDGVPG